MNEILLHPTSYKVRRGISDEMLADSTGGKRGRRNRGGRRGKPRSAHDGNAIAPATGAAGNRMARNSLQTFDNPTFADGDGADAGNGAEKVR